MTLVSATPPALDELLAELSRTLWKQRGLIELLQYRLEVQQLVLAASRDQRLAIALEEVEAAMEDIRRSERTRDQVVRSCAEAMGLAPTASLAELRAQVDEPWGTTLGDHQDALMSLISEAERLAAVNRELSQRGANETRSVIDAVTGSAPAGAYGPSTAARGLSRPALVDRTA